MSHTKAVVATDLVHAHGVSYNLADNFLRVLSEREAAAGKKAMSLIRLRQEIECDATSLGRFFVKPDNIFYADQIQDLQQKKRACLKSYPVHVRVVGAIQRGGLMVVKFMTPKVTLPKARPPVESIREIDRSGLAKYIGADKNTAIYSDGAPSWRTFAKKLKIPVAQVSHQQRQYAVQLRRAPRPKLSKVGGTQCIDAAWGSLKRFMPKQVKRKGKMKGVSCMNATLERRVYQWLWRKNLRADELMEMSRDKSSWCTCRRLAAGSEKQRMAVFPLSTLVKELTNWDRLKTDRADYGFFKRECHSFHAMLLQREFTPRLSPISSWKGVLLSEHCVSCLR